DVSWRVRDQRIVLEDLQQRVDMDPVSDELRRAERQACRRLVELSHVEESLAR
ncbi:hypothetical protein Dimus_006203, partial [Dionaea muscipula]